MRQAAALEPDGHGVGVRRVEAGRQVGDGLPGGVQTQRQVHDRRLDPRQALVDGLEGVASDDLLVRTHDHADLVGSASGQTAEDGRQLFGIDGVEADGRAAEDGQLLANKVGQEAGRGVGHRHDGRDLVPVAANPRRMVLIVVAGLRGEGRPRELADAQRDVEVIAAVGASLEARVDVGVGGLVELEVAGRRRTEHGGQLAERGL